MVVLVRLAVVAQADAVELGEGRIGPCHVGVRRDDVGLLPVLRDVGPAVLALEADGDGLARTDVEPPSGGGVEKEVIAVGEIGNRYPDFRPTTWSVSSECR